MTFELGFEGVKGNKGAEDILLYLCHFLKLTLAGGAGRVAG
jgi:hypothetical protein